jgi:hypothetical protein
VYQLSPRGRLQSLKEWLPKAQTKFSCHITANNALRSDMMKAKKT